MRRSSRNGSDVASDGNESSRRTGIVTERRRYTRGRVRAARFRTGHPGRRWLRLLVGLLWQPFALEGAALNALLKLPRLVNRYHVMRHGQSEANSRGIIVSDPAHALGDYGLTETGRAQVADSLRRTPLLGADCIVLSSDFRRARETAELAHVWLECAAAIEFDPRLRERGFGTHELQRDDAYHDVWRGDELDAGHQANGVESANQVMTRVTALILDCEQRFCDASLLLVSHGDVLQILQTAFAGADARSHRSLEHLQTAEIRQLQLLAKE